MKLFSHFAAAALLALPLTLAPLGSAYASEVTVNDAYVRLVPQGTPTTGAFMLLKNNGNAERKLVGVDSQAAKLVELHNHINENGMMKMRPVKEIVIKAGGETALKPGSYHVMLIDLKQALKEGDHVGLTLRFDDGSKQEVHAPVRKPMAAMPMQHDAGGKH